MYDDNSDEEASSVLVLSGSSGAGKTGAVYACATQLGIRVIEIDAGQPRSGAVIRKLVSEATQSGTQDLSLLLFDEADLVFEEDSGFHAAVCDLAKSSKSPIVLTTETPLTFPKTISPVVIEFSRPSMEDAEEALRTALHRAEYPLPSAQQLRLVAELGRRDVRRCLNAVAAVSPGSEATASTLTNWLANSGVGPVAWDVVIDSVQAVRHGHSTVASMPGATPQVFSILPSTLTSLSPGIVAVYGKNLAQDLSRFGATTACIEVLVGCSLCEHRLISDGLLVLRVPALSDGTYPVAVKIGPRYCTSLDWYVTCVRGGMGSGVDSIDSDSDADVGDSNRGLFAAPSEPRWSFPEALSHLLCQGGLGPELRCQLERVNSRFSDDGDARLALSGALEAITVAVQRVGADFEGAQDAFRTFCSLRDMVEGQDADPSLFPCPFEAIPRERQGPAKVSADCVQFTVGADVFLDDMADGLSMWSDAEWILSSATPDDLDLATLVGRVSMGVYEHVCAFANLKIESLLLQFPNETLPHDVSKDAAVQVPQCPIYSLESEEESVHPPDSDCDAEFDDLSDDSETSNLQKTFSYRSCFEKGFLRHTFKKQDFCFLYEDYFRDDVDSFRWNRPRRMLTREYALELIPMISHIVRADEERRKRRKVSRSCIKRREESYLSALTNLRARNIDAMCSFGSMI
jgi:hypothetical protein